MKTMPKTALKKAALLLLPMILTATARPADVTGPYFGQTPPGKTPQIFAPGILSLNNRLEARIAFSPDCNECFFTVPSDFNFSSVRLYYTKCVSNVWTPQVPAPFSPSGTFCGQPFFSADGNKLYFTSNHNGSGDIWSVDRTPQGWGIPQALPAPINTSNNKEEFSQTTDGTIYFDSNRPGGMGNGDIWRIRPQPPGQSLQAENLGPPVNSSDGEADAFISPDGRYLIYSSYHPGNNHADLFVTFTNGNGGWTAPVNMNQYCPGINVVAYQYGPSLSSDERYLFFVRLNYNTQQCDVYWVANPFVPQLAISQNDTNVNLSWSTNLPGFVLESVDQLGATWMPVPGVTGYSATLPADAANQFFRLRK